jgi:hypothetical protein
MAMNSLIILIVLFYNKTVPQSLFIEHPYRATLAKRRKKSRIYRKYQSTGLALAEILQDRKHKSLYIKLAKEYDEQTLLAAVKDIAQRKQVKNKGAYFMKIWKFSLSKTKKTKNSFGKKQLPLISRRTKKRR